jgi:predicted nucleic acid-binding protein
LARFVDSSVLVRYFTEDDPKRALAAEAIVESDELIVSALILSEISYVLHKHYHYPRADVTNALVQFLQRENVRMIDMPKELAAVALLKSQSSTKLSFGDALILAQMQASQHQEIYSFDKRFRDESIVVLEEPPN